jgi:hypothetical protein
LALAAAVAASSAACRKPLEIPPETKGLQDSSITGLKEFCGVAVKALVAGEKERWEALTESWLAESKDEFLQIFPEPVADVLWMAYEQRREALPNYRRRLSDFLAIPIRDGTIVKVAVYRITPGQQKGVFGIREEERKLRKAAHPRSHLYQVRFINSDTGHRFASSAWMYASGRWRFIGQLWEELPAQ